MRSGRKKAIIFSIVFETISIFLLLSGGGNVKGENSEPNFFYYSGSRKNSLTLCRTMISVRFKEGISIEEQDKAISSTVNLGPFSQRQVSSMDNLSFLPLQKDLSVNDVIETINKLFEKSEVDGAYPVFDFPEGGIHITDQFVVKFKKDITQK